MCFCVVLATSPASACEAEDIEDVPTPLTLLELLPEGGIAAVDIDYWTVTQIKRNGQKVGSDTVTRWTIKPDGERLIFTQETHAYGRHSYHRTYRTTYTSQGELVSYQYDYHRLGKKTMAVTGEVEEGEVVTTVTRYDGEGNETGVEPGNRLSLDPYESSVPSAWQPLVFAYHIRKGSLGYRFDRTDITRGNMRDGNVYEDLGSEQVEFDGQTATAHLLIGKREAQKARRDTGPWTLTQLVLPSGVPITSTLANKEYEYISRRVTPEQVKEKYGLEVE